MACDTLTVEEQQLLDHMITFGIQPYDGMRHEVEVQDLLLEKLREIMLDHQQQVAMNEILRRKKGLLNERNKFLNDALRKLKEKLVVAETKLRKELT